MAVDAKPTFFAKNLGFEGLSEQSSKLLLKE